MVDIELGDAAATLGAPWPFFHSDVLATLRGLRGTPVRVEGVRGGGRTVLAKALVASGFSAGKPQLVPGRNREESKRLLADLGTADPPGDVVVDDCDRLLRSARDAAPDREVVASLWSVKERISNTQHRLVMILSGDPSELLAYDTYLSDLIQSSEPIEMKPWNTEWSTLLRDETVARYSGEFGETTIKIFGHSLLLTEQLIREWTEATYAITGGHPSLVGPAMALLSRQIDTGTRDTPSTNYQGDHSALVPAISTHVARVGLPYIRRRIGKLRESDLPADRKASEILVRIAQHGGRLSATDVAIPDVDAALERECLAYLDQTEGVYQILGSIIVDEVMQSGSPSARLPQIVSVVSAPGDETRGAVVAVRGGGRVVVPFEGSPWRILRALEASRGKTVSLDRLAETTELTTSAIRTALQRLWSGLRKHDLGGIIENVRGVGYRLLG